eukprot:GDKH01000426.1.p1 GENE.GDKH01000426.1~~GDKH01000426.1.p1  ORF type:complete len:54 (+),score=1.35 GDKH01000426.1:53-214(+)
MPVAKVQHLCVLHAYLLQNRAELRRKTLIAMQTKAPGAPNITRTASPQICRPG